MNNEEPTEPSFHKIRDFRRKVISLSPETLVKSGYLDGCGPFPLVLQPAIEHLNAATWASEARQYIEGELLKHGAILFRGFEIEDARKFEEFARALSPQLLDYTERSSPRSEISQGIYTSTDHPADQYIHFHNEQSYSHSWPMKLWFYCLQPPDAEGFTLIADGRRVFNLINPAIRKRFMDGEVMYLRNYHPGLGLSWQTAFQTTSKTEVEKYCLRNSIQCEWGESDRLRTRQFFKTIVPHPKTKELVWFEHMAFFHISSVPQDVREILLREFTEDNLPFNTYYADGSPIESSVLEELREAYRRVACQFPWRRKDLLLIDNMLVSHGRSPFSGPRKILVAMSELFGASALKA